MKVSGIFLIVVFLFGANNAKPGNTNEQTGIQQQGRRANSNSQEKVQQMGGSNSNEQSKIQQMGRRANTNSQTGVQQHGNGNSNSQQSVQQHTRRSNMNSQSNVQQKGRGNSNSQSDIQQMAGRRAMVVRDCPPFLDPTNCYRRMIGSRANTNSQSQVQQYGGDNSNSQSGIQQKSRRFSVVPELNDQYQFGGAYEPVLFSGPEVYNPVSEYGVENAGVYPDMTLGQQHGLLGGVYGSYGQGMAGSQWGGPQYGAVVPQYGAVTASVPEYSAVGYGSGAGYGNSLPYGSLGGQYQQSSLGYVQAQSPYGQAQVYG